MGNYFVGQVLTSEAPNRCNCGEDGRVKSIPVGGVERKLASGQWLKRGIKMHAGTAEVRSSDIERLVQIYMEELADSSLNADEVYTIGEQICVKAFGNNFWKKLFEKPKKEEKEASEEETKAEKEESGRTIVVTSVSQFKAIANAAIDTFKKFREDAANATKENSTEKDEKQKLIFDAAVVNDLARKGEDGKELGKKDIAQKRKDLLEAMEKAMTKAAEKSAITAAEAMGGKFAASGVTGSVYSAAHVADSISIDPLTRTYDFRVAKGLVSGEMDKNSDDPAYRALARFAEYVKNKPGSDNMHTVDLASNTMYRYMDVDIQLFFRELGKHGQYTDAEMTDIAIETFTSWFEGLYVASPGGAKTLHSSNTRPGIFLFEAVSHGAPCQADWTEPIVRTDERGVMEGGIDHLLEEACDETFNVSQETRRYAMIRRSLRGKYEKKLEELGIKVLNNLDEFKAVVAEETVRLREE